jgi:hypothetical protein
LQKDSRNWQIECCQLCSARQFHKELKEVPMHKNSSLLFGITLVILALLALGGTLLGRIAGSGVSAFQNWPLAVIGGGLLFCIPPFIFGKNRGLGGLFIPGVPVLTTGLLLFAASVTGNWGLWGIFWPLEVVGVAVGFLMAAIFLRVAWLTLPASIVGFTGLALQFSALTGLWEAWAALWTVVPFSVGLPLLLIGIFQKMDGVKLAGMIVLAFAGLAFAVMAAIIGSSSPIITIGGPILILVVGVLLILSALFGKKAAA